MTFQGGKCSKLRGERHEKPLRHFQRTKSLRSQREIAFALYAFLDLRD